MQGQPNERSFAFITVLSFVALLTACAHAEPTEGRLDAQAAFIGMVAADEPRAALIGRDILLDGGSAADAAIAMGMTLTVTLPSRAGLAGGGICQLYDPDKQVMEIFDFLPEAASPKNDVAVPATPRGLYALYARHGRRAWGTLLTPAENLTKFGFTISRALAKDIALYQKNGMAEDALKRYTKENGSSMTEGEKLYRFDLATVLSRLRSRGAGDFYNGTTAQTILREATEKNLSIPAPLFTRYAPSLSEPQKLKWGHETVLLPSTDRIGGFLMQRLPKLNDQEESVRIEALSGLDQAPASKYRDQPATTGFSVADSYGQSVSCLMTMGNFFGTGKSLKSSGIFLATPLTAAQREKMELMTIVNENVAEFRMSLTATGEKMPETALLTAARIRNVPETPTAAMQTVMPVTKPVSSGRLNLLSCAKGLPPFPESCKTVAAPTGAGIARIVGHIPLPR